MKNDAWAGAVAGVSGGALIAGVPGAVIGFGLGAIFGGMSKAEANLANRLFVSFDYDHDVDLKELLVGELKGVEESTGIQDWSVKGHIPRAWKEEVRTKLRRVDQVVVICGKQTHLARGVSAEIEIAREECMPYILLRGFGLSRCRKPLAARPSDKVYEWNERSLRMILCAD